jgi:hypothetical protein
LEDEAAPVFSSTRNATKPGKAAQKFSHKKTDGKFCKMPPAEFEKRKSSSETKPLPGGMRISEAGAA